MKYRVYVIEAGTVSPMTETDNAREAADVYNEARKILSYPRLSIDGKQMRIINADKWAIKHQSNGRTGMDCVLPGRRPRRHAQ